MKTKNTLNLKEFSQLIQCAPSYMSNLIKKHFYDYAGYDRGGWVLKRNASTMKWPIYKGLEIPQPMIGAYDTNRKLWHITDANRFKRKLEKLIKANPNFRPLNPKGKSYD